MRTKYSKLYTITRLVSNGLSLWLIWYCATYVRFELGAVLAKQAAFGHVTGPVPSIGLVLLLWLPVSLWLDMSRSKTKGSLWHYALRWIEKPLVVTTITALATFFSRTFGDFVSRLFVPVVFPVALFVFVAEHWTMRSLYTLARKHWLRPIRVAIVGDRNKAGRVIERMQRVSTEVVRGVILPEGALVSAGGVQTIPVLGTTSQLADVVNREQLDRLVVVDTSLSGPEFAHCATVARNMDLDVSCALDFVSEPFRIDLGSIYGLEFVHLEPVHFTRGQQIVKRAFDVVISVLVLMLIGPAMLVTAFLIKLTSQGPVFYKSLRVGKGGRYFSFLKFRSMYTNTDRSRVAERNEKAGHIFKMRNDPRITPLGKILRRYSIDELPQLINVLRGDMSLVGPRPLPISDLAADGMSEQFALWAESRAQAPPGLTGLWQISGRSDLSFEDMVRLDLTYIQNWSVWLDLKILRDTPLVVLRGVGAY